EYAQPTRQAWVQRFYDPYFDGGPWGGFMGMGYRGWGWGGGLYMAPTVINVPVQVVEYTLSVVIKDRQKQGAQVYKSTAISHDAASGLAQVMPYLARAVFDGFPGNNGQIRQVDYERER